MQSRLRALNTRFIVVILPTKQQVYRNLVRKTGANVPASFFEVLDKEESLATDIERFLKEHEIEFVNATSALRSSLEKGTRLFAESDDSHPNGRGYEVIAEAVLTALQAPKR